MTAMLKRHRNEYFFAVAFICKLKCLKHFSWRQVSFKLKILSLRIISFQTFGKQKLAIDESFSVQQMISVLDDV